MEKPTHLHLLLFLLSSLCLGPPRGAGALGRAAAATFDVGVVLDTKSWIGNISWTCMTMAVEDFYATHPRYTGRLALHLRESDKDAFTAASAAIDLLKNVRVQAIIGPQRSTQANFVIEIGDKARVPVISFSVKSPSLSSKQSPYFIRTAINDSSQAKVIASIVQTFKWREVVPVFEDTDYGTGFVPYLIDELQEIDARVPYRSMIPLTATKDQILEELYKLKNLRTRVFVVHMSYSLGLHFFSKAKEAGMMGEGYVWIATYGLTDLVDIMGSSATDVMQGVLGIKPYVRDTSKLRDFKVRWRKKFYEGNPNAEVTEPTAFGLWAYDTVWLLARAAHSIGAANSTFLELDTTNSSTDFARLGISQNGPKLLNVMRSTDFDGMSGKFQLIEGQLESKAFEITNVVGRQRRIGFWTPAQGISGRIDSRSDLKVIWPGEQMTPPKGWEWPTSGKMLRIGVPVKPGFSQFVNLDKDPLINKSVGTGHCVPPLPSNKSDGRGYSIQVFETVMAALPYHVPYCYILYENAKGESNGTYDDLVYQVYLQKFDAVVGDVTIIANRSLYVDFTLPYTESGVSMVVPIKDKSSKTAWTFLDPLTTDLWLASGAFFVLTGIVVWFMEHRINDEFRGTRSQQLGTVFYFSFSTLVFAHRERVVSNLSRVVVIIWVFVVLILTSSYTASLSSMLTAQQLQPTMNDMSDLIRSGYKVGYLNDSFMPGLLKRMKFNETNLIGYNSPEEYDEVLSNGTVAAIVDELPYIKVFLSKYCNKYTMVGPTYKTDGFGFVFPRGSPLVGDVSRAILKVTESDAMTGFEKLLYGNRSCSDEGSTSTSGSLTLTSFWGIFLITGVTSMAALFLHLIFFLYEHRKVLRSDGSENSVRQKLALLAKLHDQMNTSSHAAKKTDGRDGLTTGDIMALPCAISGPQSPSGTSIGMHENFDSEDEIGVASEGEGTPGRDVSSQIPDPPSFAEMLDRRS